MKLLALDLSTSTGVALYEDGKLKKYWRIEQKAVGREKAPNYPQNFIEAAEVIAKNIYDICVLNSPDQYVIEEINNGKDRYAQKQLEFIHFAVNKRLDLYESRRMRGPSVKYMDSGEWRKVLGITLDKEQRKHNKEHKTAREDKLTEILDEVKSERKLQHLEDLKGITGKRNLAKAMKDFDKECLVKAKKRMRSFRSPTSKITQKTLSVAYVNKHFDLNFKMKDNDIADAICLGQAYIKKYANVDLE